MKKKLQLNKESLLRLQDQQLLAAAGGAADGNSNGGRDPGPNSCCKKTCNGKEEPSPNDTPTIN